jgi:hypothetical protein
MDDREAGQAFGDASSVSRRRRGWRNIPSLSTILEVCEVLGADAGAMIREVAEARRMPRAKTS